MEQDRKFMKKKHCYRQKGPEIIVVLPNLLPNTGLRGVVNGKNGLFTVKLTIRVDPPPPLLMVSH